VRVGDAEQWFRRGDELADKGGVEAEAPALLRAAMAAGHGLARVRLAVFLLLQYSEADDASHAEALQLLGEAVGDSTHRCCQANSLLAQVAAAWRHTAMVGGEGNLGRR
jgi:hypothetical protein